MNMRLGILGCQSIHAEKFAEIFNVQKKFPGWCVAYICGDDAPEKLSLVARKGLISDICDSQDELLEKSDAVLITYRDSRRHFIPAVYCLQKGIPVFVDKPFTSTPEEAAELISLSYRNNTLLSGGSTLCADHRLKKAQMLLDMVSFGLICYRANFYSEFGGYRFYGSHLTDLCAAAFGTEAVAVRSSRKNDSIDSVVRYPDKIIVLHSGCDFSLPYVVFNTANNLRQIELDENMCYQNGMADFVEAIKKRKIDSKKLRCLQFSVNLLDSIIRSLEYDREVDLPEIKLP